MAQSRTGERLLIGAYVDRSDRELLAARARLAERSLSAELRIAIAEHLRSSFAQHPSADGVGDGDVPPLSSGEGQ